MDLFYHSPFGTMLHFMHLLIITILINDIHSLVDFILKHNIFVFDLKRYLQINGTAMKKWYQHSPYIFIPWLNVHPTAYFWVIDLIFLVWPHGIDTLETFQENANGTHPNISFTHVYSTTAVSFLDVITKIIMWIIYTRSYKENGQHSISPLKQLTSYAHEKFYIFFTTSQMKRIYSDKKDFIKHSNELVTHFLHIGYPNS